MRVKRKLEEEEEDPLEEEEGESMRDTQMPLVVFDLVRERERTIEYYLFRLFVDKMAL